VPPPPSGPLRFVRPASPPPCPPMPLPEGGRRVTLEELQAVFPTADSAARAPGPLGGGGGVSKFLIGPEVPEISGFF